MAEDGFRVLIEAQIESGKTVALLGARSRLAEKEVVPWDVKK